MSTIILKKLKKKSINEDVIGEGDDDGNRKMRRVEVAPFCSEEESKGGESRK